MSERAPLLQQQPDGAENTLAIHARMPGEAPIKELSQREIILILAPLCGAGTSIITLVVSLSNVFIPGKSYSDRLTLQLPRPSSRQ